MFRLAAAVSALALLAGCGSVDAKLNQWRGHSPGRLNAEPVLASPPETKDAQRVLVILNQASSESLEIGAYYRQKRQIPKENVVLLQCPAQEEVSLANYQKTILEPVRAAIRASKTRIDFLVLTRGVPIRIQESGDSVDGALMAMDSPVPRIPALTDEGLKSGRNPYFQSREPFRSDQHKLHLATRLDGYTVADAKRLVDSSLAARPETGPFLLDEAGNRTSGGYAATQQALGRAEAALKAKGLIAILEKTPEFAGSASPLAGYASWGSNDGAFKLETYRSLRFKPGALAETYVSTSARTFRQTSGGQSLIADLIAQGVTGVKGYVSEPYTFALAEVDILLDRYTAGMTLAESFYAASRFIKWKDVVIGDPICRPYPALR